ncbi:MAG: hypothetical protein CO029_02660 [Candidatus Magasanikbacteria bacterium CG_4_9_14_0_2_um_filter_41_10]|uniref:DUF4145 domain-containing protein n=1 Tax=Candidatus Magasanikbacteria bacterium CG_4_10_14_0_2_um_filter_41_31 TaxID=1974639 RepID=A0A2M7V304_9BACT|nr:MAG: hypothetical protein AUJ37_02905 [Candidatus Magasanikbacteria bacterium CG1_02_41_34]PIZ92848.1 MAG: hypothetical protein COX83_03350 [Candidatus Magasanikbacteria bacterium CG_4_10_14_0_2_um_filter_41_31]PJC53468.1 MAG: hypothetical protein CO029_02660 [Candidatus Magasanikbacteria bacterium CG_4_9_14_0_2_um_filter_41_10]
MRKEIFYPPKHAEKKYHCPHCGVFAKQFWSHIQAREIWGNSSIDPTVSFSENLRPEWTISKCEHCSEKVIWLSKSIIYPKKMNVPLPNEDLSDDIQSDYFEAAAVLEESVRSSAALLRLALQKLCKQLGEKGKDINDDIKSLVKKGLNSQIQQSLDILRITGNNAVHPGQINLEENRELVLKLFDLINFIAEKMITEPKEISSFYGQLPDSSKEAIVQRDKTEDTAI